jgi:hypothetical protein
MKPVTTPKPVTASGTTLKPVTMTTTKPGSTAAPVVSTDYCKINTCTVMTDNTLCKYTVLYNIKIIST